MKINILTLFPDFFSTPFSSSILKRAQDGKLHKNLPPLEINIINIRDFSTDKHHTADDHPYGGGAGMVMKVEPIHRALESLSLPEGKNDSQSVSKIILTSAKGRLFTQQVAQEYSLLEELTIICGHYEGVDQRVSDYLVDEEIRIGDYVLTGGEPATVVIVDAVSRLLSGVLGNEESSVKESHSEPGYFEHPQYTRPEVYNGWEVPKVLLSGNHKEIEEWKLDQHQ